MLATVVLGDGADVDREAYAGFNEDFAGGCAWDLAAAVDCGGCCYGLGLCDGPSVVVASWIETRDLDCLGGRGAVFGIRGELEDIHMVLQLWGS